MPSKKDGRMGRGRQRAKHTKVARELKYSVADTDYAELEKELKKNDGDREKSTGSGLPGSLSHFDNPDTYGHNHDESDDTSIGEDANGTDFGSPETDEY